MLYLKKSEMKRCLRHFYVGQDNRELCENHKQSRCCESGVFFQPKGSHCENGKTKKYVEAKVRRPAFSLC